MVVPIAGMSLGGMIAQVAALRNPDRVLTVTCLSSGIFEDDPSLPSIDPRIIDFQAKALPTATLISLEGVGHEIHYNEWDFIIDSMVAHFTNR